MFSHRTTWVFKKNRWTLLLQSKRQEGARILDLTESNPTRAGFRYPKSEILHATSDPRSLVYKPNPLGLGETRQAVANYYAARGQIVPADDILLTASTSEAYSYLFKLSLDPGENLLAPEPSYPLLHFLAQGESVTLIPYPLYYKQGWHLNLREVEAGINPETRALVIVSPNNPTGSYLKQSEWEILKELCLRYSLAIICDQVFFDYPLDAKKPPFDPLSDPEILTFVLSGLSKVLGLPQLKLSWMVMSGPGKEKKEALERLEVISDTFLSVGTLAQHAASKLLGLRSQIQSQIQGRIRGNLNTLHSLLSDSPSEILAVEGGWYAIIRLPETRSDEEWSLELLAKRDVAVHPGYLYNLLNGPHVVLSLLPEEEIFREGVTRLSKAIPD